MSGNKFFLDTNIILYLLDGDQTLATFLYEKQLYISFITELELLGFDGITKKEEVVVRDFLQQCKIFPINTSIKEETIRIQRKYHTKLPDSIIIATALQLDLPLVSADNTFTKVEELNFIHYKHNQV